MQKLKIDKNVRELKEEVRHDKIKIETPYGTIESDSGNHYLDIATVVIVILACALVKYIIVKKIRK